MNFRWLNAIFWGNSVALSWMWGLGLFFSVQMTFMFGLQGLLTFAIPNALGLALFGVLTQIVAKRNAGGQESLAIFFDKYSKPFRLAFYLYQIVALALTVFAITSYLFDALGFGANIGSVGRGLYLTLVVFMMLAAGCLFGEEFGIQKIKYGHALAGIGLLICIGVILFVGGASTGSFVWKSPLQSSWTGPSLLGYTVPLLVGLLVGPWLDLQHWQRAIQIHREKSSIALSYIIGGAIFFLLLIFHGFLAMWVMGKGPAFVEMNKGFDGFNYAHDLVTRFFSSQFKEGSVAPVAYFTFLVICAVTTLDSGYVALKWFLGGMVEKSQNVLLSMVPKQVITSPIPSFLLVAVVTIGGLALKLELEYFMVFYASFIVGYAALAIARCFVPNSQQSIPQIRMFSMASMSVVIFSFGYFTSETSLLILGSVLPLAYVIWLVVNTDLLRVVTEKAGEVIEAASSSDNAAIKAIAKTVTPAVAPVKSEVVVPADAHALGGHFEGKWFVYSMIATYADTNSVGNVYFGMYGMYVGKTRELFFAKAMPDFDLKTTKFFILTRSFEHKFVREAREFDTITVKIRVADFNRKFCTLEHQIFGSENQLLGKGQQSLLFVSSKDYSLLDIPPEMHKAFLPYL
ncbi:MAG TPA: acyl-CoA thioesterase [Luteolibacter sp.]|nr:acyl-CoA thioesterase [Luteolibacter sp.]